MEKGHHGSLLTAKAFVAARAFFVFTVMANKVKEGKLGSFFFFGKRTHFDCGVEKALKRRHYAEFVACVIAAVPREVGRETRALRYH